MTGMTPTRRRGSILIVAMWVVIALTGLVLALSYAMRIEAIAGANRLAQAQADAAERGMEQFLVSVVDNEVTTPGSFQDLSMEARQIGDCQVWVVRPDWDSRTEQLTYGLTDEAGKVDLNSATSSMLLNLPGMTQELVDCIIDWRNPSTTPSAQGAKDEYYGTLQPEPYTCKKASYETVEELLLVKGITKDLLFGFDRNRNGILDAKEQAAGGMTALVDNASTGIFPFVTVYGQKATPAASGVIDVSTLSNNNKTRFRQTLINAGVSSATANQIANFAVPTTGQKPTFGNVFEFYFKVNDHKQGLLTIDDFRKVLPKITASGPVGPTSAPTAAATRAKVNVNTAPTQVLACLPTLEESDAAAIIGHRQSLSSDPTDISWLATVLTRQKAIAIGERVTGKSIVYSGDIVAVSPDGKAFRRCRVVIQGQTTASGKTNPTRIIYRRDLTASGWPLPPEIRAAIRSGQGYQSPVQSSSKGGTPL